MDKIDWTFTFALYFFEVWHCHLENLRKIHKLQFFKDKLDVIPLLTLFQFRSYSIRSYSNLDLVPPLCNWACHNLRSYSIRSYSLDLIPTSNFGLPCGFASLTLVLKHGCIKPYTFKRIFEVAFHCWNSTQIVFLRNFAELVFNVTSGTKSSATLWSLEQIP